MQYKTMGRTAVALAVGLSVLLTGCSAQATPDEAAEAATTSPEPSPSETAPAGPSLPGGEIVRSPKGEYLQSTITADDPILKYDPSKTPGNLEEYLTPEQLQKGQEFALRYIVEEMIDSPLNNNPDADVDDWWNEHKRLFDPGLHESFRDGITDENGPVLRNPWQADIESFAYDYVYSSTETRFSNLNLNVKDLYFTEKGVLVVNTDFDVTAKVRIPDGIGYETLYVDATLGLIPSDLNESGWAISYYKWDPTNAELPEQAENELRQKESAEG
ncbi:hypothetical protein ACFVRT_15915 [Arthrobacter koreensis]|uniref:hypothetical protein n=1 Tax=Arthrobacter koreensis TaxID=199136 RepID=UPI0036DE7BBC